MMTTATNALHGPTIHIANRENSHVFDGPHVALMVWFKLKGCARPAASAFVRLGLIVNKGRLI
jgi:hypothetical protein